MSRCASSRSAGDLHSVVQYAKAVRSLTKRFAGRSLVRPWRAMAHFAPTGERLTWLFTALFTPHAVGHSSSTGGQEAAQSTRATHLGA